MGGTNTVVATLTVTTIDKETGSVLTVTILAGGNYTVPPTNPAATTGGSGTGATFTLTFTGTALTGAVVVAGGGPWPRGYRVGDLLQFKGGTNTAPASVRVTGSNGGGQVTSVTLVTGGTYTGDPCNPAPTIGGHGCGAKFQWTMVAGAITVVVLADGGGPCWTPPKKWWQITEVELYPAGGGPPDEPRNKACGKLIMPDISDLGLLDPCTVAPARPVMYLWLPSATEIHSACCDDAGDVVEVPAKSGRLYNVWWYDYVDLDERCRCRGSCCCTGERIVAVLQQQCPFAPGPPVAEDFEYWSNKYWG